MTSDWSAPPPGSRSSGGRNSGGELSDAAIDARDRIAAALRNVGPELDAALSAVCLEGRGLDEIERRFGWPQRSGKVVLRIALARLADHYGFAPD